MALTPGSRLGPYEVTALLGEGGMGQVYRATDTNLKRQVAIKVLPASLAGDANRLARFQREAEVLATLNHPNIAAIYGLEKAADFTALVMELVDGDDLSDRIAQGAIPLDEALPIAKQITEALEAAHEQGIIHRDLKPANIKVRSDGTVKVLDFGLAKALDGPAKAGHIREGEHGRSVRLQPDLSASPTLTSPAMTQAGMILGTAAYMAPEQAKGRAVDRRADIWAFGAVLYEMLTGTRAFRGDDVQDTFVAIMRDEPDWTRLPTTLSPTLATFLKRCLHKDQKQRVGDIRDVRLALEGAFETAVPQTTAPTASSTSRGRLPWIAALAAMAVLVAAMAMPTARHLREAPPVPAPPETRLEIATPVTEAPASFALSPDGRRVVFVASSDGVSRLWLRPLATTTAQPLPGTEGALDPFWSPDSRSIGFFAAGSLKRLDLDGGAPTTLAAAGGGRGGAWSADGVIVFVRDQFSPLLRMSESGGDAVAVTALGPGQQGHRWPNLLPDGHRVLFYVRGSPETAGIWLGDLSGGTPTRLTAADGAGVYLSPRDGHAEALREGGWLAWVRAGTLVAQRLDVDTPALQGEPVVLAEGMLADDGNRGVVAAATSALIAYRTGGAGRQRQLTWFDRSGATRGTVGEPDSTLNAPSLSFDGHRAAATRSAQGNVDIWLLDATRSNRFTFDAAMDEFPIWSPAGDRVVFRSTRSGHPDLWEKRTSGAGAEQLLLASDQQKTPSSWSADGRFLLYQNNDPDTGLDLWVLPMVGEHTASVFLKTRFTERNATFSPDGRWVAYQSDESGRPEVYVRRFVPPALTPATGADRSAPLQQDQTGAQWQVSTGGGIYPVWRRDGRELYYLAPNAAMMAAPMAQTGSALAPGAPVVLFSTRIYGGGVEIRQGRQFDVSPDGRFLINTAQASAAEPITLVQNWSPDARK